MAGSETLTSGEYIKHHLTNLTFGQFPDGHWGVAHSAEQAKEMGFWAIHLDSMFWSLGLAALFGYFFYSATVPINPEQLLKEPNVLLGLHPKQTVL